MSWHKPAVHGDKPGGRSAHTASLVDNKFIYIFGGWNGDEELGDLRMLDTETLTWTAPRTKGTQPAPRHFHTSSRILQTLYVFGGYDGDEWRNDTVSLDIDSLTWSNISFAGPLPPVRASHSSSVINDNRMLVFGGYDGDKFLNDLWILDVPSMTHHSHRWSKIDITPGIEEPLWPRPRSGHTATTLQNANGEDSIILLFGGRHKDGRCNELFYLETDKMKWTEPKVSGKVPTARKTHAATAVGNRFYVLGGHDGERPLGQVVHVLEFSNLIVSPKRKSELTVPPSTLTEEFRSMLNASDSFSDVTFLIEDKPVRLHKSILAARSEYFRRMFSSGFAEGGAATIVIREISYNTFLALCEYLYTDQMSNPEHAMELLLQSEKMSLTRLSALCQSVLEEGIDVHSVTGILDAADMFGATDLREVCMRYILDNFSEVSTEDAFIYLRTELYREVLIRRKPVQRVESGNSPSDIQRPINFSLGMSVVGGGSTVSGVSGGGEQGSSGSRSASVTASSLRPVATESKTGESSSLVDMLGKTASSVSSSQPPRSNSRKRTLESNSESGESIGAGSSGSVHSSTTTDGPHSHTIPSSSNDRKASNKRLRVDSSSNQATRDRRGGAAIDHGNDDGNESTGEEHFTTSESLPPPPTGAESMGEDEVISGEDGEDGLGKSNQG
jgi:hypothetical protein